MINSLLSFWDSAKRTNFLRVHSLVFIFLLCAGLLSSCGGMMSTTVLEPESKERVVKVPSSSQNQLYIKANNWMVETFNNAESVIQFQDKESGVVTGKYLMESIIRGTQVSPENVYAIIKIMVKDGAAKIVIKPDSYVNNYNAYAGGTSYPLEKASYEMDNLIASFTKAMQAKPDDF